MLARISGGNSGIAEYLETGIKNGRDFSRDELDQRLIIDGDLALTQSVIDSIEDKGQDRYLHITLSFRENDISRETIKAVTEEYKELLLSAYSTDEIQFLCRGAPPQNQIYHRQKNRGAGRAKAAHPYRDPAKKIF